MNADRLFPKIVPAFILILLGISTSCAPTATPTLFHPPSGLVPSATLPSTLAPVEATPIIFPTDTPPPILEPPTPIPPCTDNLSWLADVSFADDTTVQPGQSIDKQWLVQNSGTCDWDARYTLRNINGETLGASAEIPLFPARAGAQVTLRIVFVAPSAAGTVRSEWQAAGPDGTLFGDTVYIQIVVSP
ncbi:MAG: hypothetical protein C4583_00520 [Anaerolineaceae bacterium]|nr:MAG: hypothetical protein C4583_00520 [Anaerolineaceae bacterium]